MDKPKTTPSTTFAQIALHDRFAEFMPRGLFFQAHNGLLIPSDHGILSHAEWEELCGYVNGWYATVTPKEIEAFNSKPNKPSRASSHTALAPCEAQKRVGYVYLLRSASRNYKIGRSIDLARRVKDLQTSNGGKVTLVHSFQSEDSYRAEKTLHEKYATRRTHGEWFSLTATDVREVKAIGDFQL